MQSSTISPNTASTSAQALARQSTINRSAGRSAAASTSRSIPASPAHHDANGARLPSQAANAPRSATAPLDANQPGATAETNALQQTLGLPDEALDHIMTAAAAVPARPTASGLRNHARQYAFIRLACKELNSAAQRIVRPEAPHPITTLKNETAQILEANESNIVAANNNSLTVGDFQEKVRSVLTGETHVELALQKFPNHQKRVALLGVLREKNDITHLKIDASDMQDTFGDVIPVLQEIQANNSGLRDLNLDLSKNRLTEEHINALSTLTSLKTLNLDHTWLRDEKLQLLHQFTTLKELSVRHTVTTNKAVEALKEALPATTVHSSPQVIRRFF